MSQKAARPERTGLKVAATLSVATGPKIQVTGARGRPMATTLVWASMFMPVGWNTAVVKNGFWPWARA